MYEFVLINIEYYIRKGGKNQKMQQITNEEKIQTHLKQLKKQQKQAEELQKEYDFSIPFYVVSEMLKENENVISLINMAQISNRISKENADILKERLK